MPILLLIWNNKRWTLIIVLIFLLFWQTWLSNKYANELNKADIKCAEKISKAIQPFKDAEKKAQEKANTVSEKYEQSKATEQIKTETITREVQKIITQPIYSNNCFDYAGVSIVNQAAGIADSSEPETTLP